MSKRFSKLEKDLDHFLSTPSLSQIDDSTSSCFLTVVDPEDSFFSQSVLLVCFHQKQPSRSFKRIGKYYVTVSDPDLEAPVFDILLSKEQEIDKRSPVKPVQPVENKLVPREPFLTRIYRPYMNFAQKYWNSWENGKQMNNFMRLKTSILNGEPISFAKKMAEKIWSWRPQ